MALIFVINGPNLNLLGSREPKHYGNNTLEDIELRLKSMAQDLGHQLEHIQHNHEGTLIDLIHEAGKHEVDFIIINPAAYTHTSVAIRDALAAVAIPFIEVHLSNIYRREAFRQHSYFSDLALGVISGLGAAQRAAATPILVGRPTESIHLSIHLQGGPDAHASGPPCSWSTGS